MYKKLIVIYGLCLFNIVTELHGSGCSDVPLALGVSPGEIDDSRERVAALVLEAEVSSVYTEEMAIIAAINNTEPDFRLFMRLLVSREFLFEI